MPIRCASGKPLLRGPCCDKVFATICCAIAPLALAVLLSGCSNDRGPERVIVSGAITFQGKPVSEGIIRFMPVAGSDMPMGGADIKDGRYRVTGRGGVPVGTHRVEIEGFRVDKSRLKPGEPMPASAMLRGVPHEQFIPQRYNLASTLQITIESGSGEITKNFDLTE
jgi:hypothetical protein